MSAIKRTYESESYSTTVRWLKDFTDKISKSAMTASQLRPTASTEKFATIEDKMKDIKARVGFDSITSLSKKESEEIIVNSSDKKSNKKIKKPSKERIASLQVILKYIEEMIAAEPHLLEPEIRARCMDNIDLGFESLRIKSDELRKFIDDKKGPSVGLVEIKYFRPVNDNTGHSEEVADYYQHGTPSTR